ncbi:group II intron reverse transcriptase domain-containing protein [Candidatus Pacearchaeota archaeon]|nr:group II intron reverse transcriptase domain-containing protein [Candidatus Pacearchaeota archaeon]
MKTHKNLFQEVCEYGNLNNAYLKARRGKNYVSEALNFDYNLENGLVDLQCELRNQTYETGKYRHFIIFEPKERKISALPFRDRVVHHAVCNVIEPMFEKKFIYDSYACRKGKGTHAGADKLQKFIRSANDNYYVLKCDVSKYFPSVNQEILKQLIREKIADKKLLWLSDNIINSAGRGIPIGNLTSQLFANIYLNKLDEYMKYELKIKYYIRYMDDFIILHESKQYLHEVKENVRVFFVSMKLTLHPKKANIFPITLGIDFLGYRIFNNHRLIRKSTVKRFLKIVKRKIEKYDYGVMSFDKLMESFNSWEAYMAHGDSYKLKNSLHKEYFKNVM